MRSRQSRWPTVSPETQGIRPAIESAAHRSRVLVVGPEISSAGGIAAVIETLASSSLADSFDLVLVSTYRDSPALRKALHGVLGAARAAWLLATRARRSGVPAHVVGLLVPKEGRGRVHRTSRSSAVRHPRSRQRVRRLLPRCPGMGAPADPRDAPKRGSRHRALTDMGGADSGDRATVRPHRSRIRFGFRPLMRQSTDRRRSSSASDGSESERDR